MGNCCTYPNGRLTLVPSLLNILALFLSFWGLFDCKFAGQIGLLWHYAPNFYFYSSTWDVGVCEPYSSFEESMIKQDGTFTAARGFGVAAVVCGFVMTIAIWVIAPCIPVPKIGWRIIGLILFMIGLFQMFTLLILSSSFCSSACTDLGTGGILSIVSGVLWFASAILCCLISEPVRNDDGRLPVLPVTVETPVTQNHHVVKETTTQQHIEPDGTIVKEIRTTRADGGMTVTKEVIPPGTAVASVVANNM